MVLNGTLLTVQDEEEVYSLLKTVGGTEEIMEVEEEEVLVVLLVLEVLG